MAVPSPRSLSVVAVFDRVADSYDQVGIPWFTPIAARLVDELAPAEGERALDVGCGRGAVLFPLADAVGPQGFVTGIDLAPGMVERVGADARERGLDQVTVQVLDAQAPDLPAASFDLVASSLVLFFLPDPVAALARWHDLLVPGGRVGVATFGPQDPRWVDVDDAFTPYLPPALLDARTSGASGPFGSDAGVENLLKEAGFAGARTVHGEAAVRFDDAGRWRDWVRSHGQRAMWDAVPEDRRDDVLADATERLEAARDQDGQIVFTQDIRYTLGRRP